MLPVEAEGRILNGLRWRHQSILKAGYQPLVYNFQKEFSSDQITSKKKIFFSAIWWFWQDGYMILGEIVQVFSCWTEWCIGNVCSMPNERQINITIKYIGAFRCTVFCHEALISWLSTSFIFPKDLNAKDVIDCIFLSWRVGPKTNVLTGIVIRTE